jgi:hypothetical protein
VQKIGLAFEVHFLTADAERNVATLGAVNVAGLGHDLHLADKGKHVRGKPPVEQDSLFDLPLLAKASAFSSSAVRLFSMVMNTGMEVWYIERDMGKSFIKGNRSLRRLSVA